MYLQIKIYVKNVCHSSACAHARVCIYVSVQCKRKRKREPGIVESAADSGRIRGV